MDGDTCGGVGEGSGGEGEDEGGGGIVTKDSVDCAPSRCMFGATSAVLVGRIHERTLLAAGLSLALSASEPTSFAAGKKAAATTSKVPMAVPTPARTATVRLVLKHLVNVEGTGSEPRM